MSFSFLFKMLRWMIFTLLFILITTCIFFAVLQSKWAKIKIREYLISTLEQTGIHVHLSHLDGRLPFSWIIDEASIQWGDSEELNLHQVTLRLAVMPLFQGKIAINYVQIETADFLFSSPKKSLEIASLKEIKKQLRESLENIQLPGSLSLNRFAINQLHLINQQTQERFLLGINGQAKVRQDKKEFEGELQLFSPDSHQTYLEATVMGSEIHNRVETSFHIHVDPLPSFIPFQGELVSSVTLSGPWVTWKAVLYDIPFSEAPLLANAAGSCHHATVPSFPSLNNDWKFNTSFVIDSPEHIDLKKLILQSRQMQIHAKGSLVPQIDQSDLVMAFSLSDLSPYSSVPLAGSLEGKALYKAGHFKLSFKTADMEMGGFKANTVLGRIQGELHSDLTARVHLSSQDAEIPFENHFLLDLSRDKIAVKELLLTAENDTLQGDVTYDFTTHLYEGTLSTSIQELNRFESLFKTQRLYGNIQSQVILRKEEEKQKIFCTLSGHHMRYQNILLDEISLNCNLKEFHLLAEKIYTDGVYLEKVQIDTKSNAESLWPFSVAVSGRIDTPFECIAKGLWSRNEEQLSIELSECAAQLLGFPLKLEHPSCLIWTNDSLELTPLDLQLGLGHLQASLAVNPQSVRSAVNLQHFPLEILRCFHPRFGLNGAITAKGFIEGSPDNLQGAFNAVLEEASITHFGEKDQFHSKGSIQFHLSQNRLQIHTDLKATGNQFLDFTASLPIDYSLYPFSITLNKDENNAAELVAQGKLEDLFDFVNLGTNHFTGLLSCRLFLSQSLKTPSLLGNLELQNGSYDNYFTGIALKSIDAQFEAENSQIRLKNLTAKDDQTGLVSASGVIELKPEEQFPYHFDAEMNNLHALRFDMIDCHLSGPVYLTGNTQKMLAQGNLIIDSAKIQVTERLPYEVPSIPFTYIHKPLHLDSVVTPPTEPFAFHLDLELTAHDKVYVEGKGLNAKLEGDIHLHGTNTDIAANGKLDLVKGEYIFSGKVFKLTEASVIFNDKPTRSAYLNISGTLSMPDITITAMMRGPLTSPHLTFQSNPHKATSSILALILFNKDISEINQMEAVQLASTVISLSGGAGPDVLESIRKTIGVDRLNISSNPGSDEIAVQVGKYLTRGIMITLSQSATSSQVIVEVELPKGFVFQAETQEEEEGKFSLKWRKSY